MQTICAERGKSALTRYQVLQRRTHSSRLELKPLTGRRHQLRIHLSEIGHPILGCDMYAHTEALEMADRLMLHASVLDIVHPATGERLRVECEPDF
ncbi:MAG: tRNA pseudouridine32 synthase/23S rRNA pseudouridine746 synthase [Bacteroidia bacterium]